jgi:PAS domain S-box-containing protein
VENIRDVIYELDSQGVVLYISPVIRDLLGYDSAEIVGKNFIELAHKDDLSSLAEWFSELRKGREYPSEYRVINKSGELRWARTKTRPIMEDGLFKGARGILIDVTDQKRVEEALRESEARYRSLFENNHAVMLLIDPDNGTIVDANTAACAYYGWSREELMKRRIDKINTLTSEEVSVEMQLARSEKRNNFFFKHRRADGTIRDVEVYSGPILLQGKTLLYSIVHDVTDRKRAEERYQSIFENAQEGIFRSTPDGRIIIANQAMATMFGYESPEEMMTGVTDVNRQHYVNPEDRRKLKEMIEEHGLTKGYEAQNSRKDGSIIWISLTMQAVRDEKGQIMYCDGIIADITNRKQSVERIRKALRATVQAIAVTVETRDPYTAGHQRRVTDLACAIATEMNLPIDRIDGIRMAAAIHDLGKISVPAEILSNPKKLTNIEFSLIKTHSQSGYDILKDIDFPWPVARMVLEHHERMNGSGYPNGLTGDNTLMESRILSVADGVEAMASHRPYRPGLGIDTALNEIEKNRGIFYDDAVADACLRLFREKGFKLEGT